ncbi:hypothetical protein [Shouchella patagoniensis]|uniref:hypothetical protein n=1 Tax=Shouchella patagoniensis TaxID=228576 RepID=UPI0009959C76|nr:hypothetical protein [Shouchella patagoniensis]
MHPKEIIASFQKCGADIKLDETGVTVVNASKVSELTINYAKEYKERIINQLKGDYSAKKHAILSTNDQLIDCFLNKPVNNPDLIVSFLINNPDCCELIIKRMNLLKENGWQYDECTANYENEETDQLAEQLFNRAMAGRQKKGA